MEDSTREPDQETGRVALLLGATGLIGGHCLDLLLAEETYAFVRTLGRRKLPRTHPKLEHHTVNFDQPQSFAEHVRGDDVFCCLGTTIKKAGSREAFRRVDLEYPLEIGRIAAENGAEQFLLVSAMGAEPDSRVFYNQVKGEAERAIAEIPFRSVVILRPSLLLGERNEFRLGEAVAQPVMKLLSPLMRGPLREYRPVHARAVAAAMVRLAEDGEAGIRIVKSDGIAALANG